MKKRKYIFDREHALILLRVYMSQTEDADHAVAQLLEQVPQLRRAYRSTIRQRLLFAGDEEPATLSAAGHALVTRWIRRKLKAPPSR